MKQLPSFTLIALSLAALSGCSWIGGDKGYFRDRGSDYLQADQGSPMQLPQGVQTKRLDPLMPIPTHVSNIEQTEFAVPRATVATEKKMVDDYSLHQSGQSQWIVAQQIPAQVWSNVMGYFMAQGFRIQSESPQVGQFVTEWQTLANTSAPLAARFGEAAAQMQAQVLVRIEPGVQRNTSEIFLEPQLRQLEGNTSVETTHGSFEKTLLDALRSYLVQNQDQQQSVSLLAANRQFDTPDKVNLSEVNGLPVLVLDTSFDRAWSSVGRALEQANIAIEDLNRSASQYEINLAVAPKTQKRGWFKRTFTKDPAKVKPELYQIQLQPMGRQVEVRVMDGAEPATEVKAKSILQRLKASLS